MPAEIQSYWQVVQPLFDVIDMRRPSAYSLTCAKVPRPSRLLFAAHMTLAEVHNGGFLQLFWNNAGIVVPEAIECFEVIGMVRAMAIVSRAAALLGNPYPRNRDERWTALLSAANRDASELEQLLHDRLGLSVDDRHRAKNLFLAFRTATENLPFDSLDKELLASAATDNGGFQKAATEYAIASSRPN